MTALLITFMISLAAIGFFVLAKFSFARLGKDHVSEIEGLSEEKKEFLYRLYSKPSVFINTAQFYIIVFTMIISYVSFFILPFFESGMGKILPALGLGGHLLSIVLLTLLFSGLILIFGEILPKALGLSFPERFIFSSASLVYMAGKAVMPFVWICDRIGQVFLGLLGTKFSTEVDLVHTEEEIRMLVNRSHMEGTIDSLESELIDNVFDFVDRLAKEVMVPRQDMVCLYLEDDFEENMKIIRESRHSRYPLCMGDKDHILGLVHVKDIMDQQELGPVDLRNIRRDILTVPEVMRISYLLQFMRRKRTYFAVVVDEYGGTVGMIGLEDIMSELVGDIQDENEEKREPIVALEDGAYEFDGKVLLDEVEDTLGVEISEADEDTIGGYVFGLLGRTPMVGDEVEVVNTFIFKVLELQGYRIVRVMVTPIRIDEKEDEE